MPHPGRERAGCLREFVLDQLAELGPLDCRAMFGGHGFYRDGVFFAILFDERLYFKTSAATRTQYLERGMKPFRPTPRQTLHTYLEVPAEVLEDREQLSAWATAAIRARVT